MITYNQYIKIPVDNRTYNWLADLLNTKYRFVNHHITAQLPQYLFDMGILDSKPSVEYPGEYSIGLTGQVTVQISKEDGACYLVIPLTSGVI